MRNLIVRLFINAVALWGAARLLDGIQLTGDFGGVLVVALIFGLLNALIRPVAMLLSLPFLLLTLGLFTLVINALMLWLTAGLTSYLTVSGFGSALLGSLVISVVSIVLSILLKEKRHLPN